jgi:ankyrin repeat protein
MLELGADIDETNDLGLGAVHAAAYAGCEDVLQFLADRGAKLNQRSKQGQTPLGLAEGHLLAGSFAHRTNTAGLLRRLGAVSEGAVRLQTK